MSGGDFRGLIPASNDPMLAFLVAMQKAYIRQQNQNAVAAVDSDNEDIYASGIDVDTVIRFHSELSGETFFPFNKAYYPPFEPDGNQVKLWLKGVNTGNKLREISNFGVNATINGDPLLVDGNIDLGTITHGTKSIALRMNRPTSVAENREWLEIPDSTSLQVIGLTTGFSVFVRLRFKSLDIQEGFAPRIFQKIDDSTPNNAMMLTATETGRLVFIVKKAGVVTAKETASNTVLLDTVYDIFVTFTVAGSVMNVYVNGVNQTLTTFASAVNFQSSIVNHNLFIFRRGADEMDGFLYGDFYDMLYYRDKVVSQAEVTNHYTNKWTISQIPFGKVMITDHYATYLGTGLGGSFSSGSFSPGSFSQG